MLIHIGYPKTGTTWLQQRFFREDWLDFSRALIWNEAQDHIILPGELWFDAGYVHALAADRCQEARRAGRVPYLSNELLSGHPMCGGTDSTLIAGRLKRLWPDGKILIVIREQKRMLLSLYKEFIRSGGSWSLARYLQPVQGNSYRTFDLRYLEYDRLIGHYYELFGREQVRVLPFERFQQDPVAFCNALLEFAGSGVGVTKVTPEIVRPALGGMTIAIGSVLNKFIVRDQHNPNAPVHCKRLWRMIRAVGGLWPGFLNRAVDARLRRQIDQFVGVHYGASNARTAELTGWDLRELGYPLAEVLGDHASNRHRTANSAAR